jgi:hypothetical protein
MESGLAQARTAIARAYALVGDDVAASEALGPFPTLATDIPPYVLLCARIALWRKNTGAARDLAERLAQSKTPAPLNFRMQALLQISLTPDMSNEANAEIEAALPIDPPYQPRRISFHAQVRTELKLGAGRIEEALADLRVADTNGLIDRLWLERCPLFELVRDRPEYIAIQKSTAARAERVIEILDPRRA